MRFKEGLSAILILAFQVGCGLTFQMYGVMSVGWLLALVYTAFLLPGSKLFRSKDFRTVALLYVLMTAMQAVAEFMAGNNFVNGMKGVAVDVISFVSFFFLLNCFCKDLNLIFWAYLGVILRMLVFGKESESSAEEALMGEDATYLKFYIAPLFARFMLVLSAFFRGVLFSYIYMFLGIVFVVAGARSGGLMAFLTGFVVWIVKVRKANVTSALRRYSLPIVAVLYCFYAVYVSYVIDGTISSGNNQQLAKSDNPYNPLEIIKYSRTDAWMGLVAWADKPLWGYGSWVEPGTSKYAEMIADIQGDRNIGDTYLKYIPGHSVIFGRGAYNGIFVMFLTAVLVFFFLKRAFKLLDVDSRYVYVIVSTFFSMLWTALFSPVGHIRDSMPLFFAVILAIWVKRSEFVAHKRI